MTINKNNLTYVVSKNSVRLEYRGQSVVFNSFNCASHHKFKQFRAELIDSPKNQYDNLNDIFGLANSYSVKGCAGYQFTVHKNIAY